MDRKIPWSRFSVEAAVIVGSILLAFSIDAWWGAHQERIRLQSNLEALAQDMVIARREIDESVEANNISITAYEEAHRILHSEPRTNSQIDGGFYQQGIRIPPLPLGTLRLLVTSGDVRLISDEEVRSTLVEGLSRIELFQGWMDDLASDGRRATEIFIQAESESLATGDPWPYSAYQNADVLAALTTVRARIRNIRNLLLNIRDSVVDIEDASLKELSSF